MPIRFTRRPGLVAYITCGDPDLETSREVALAAIRAGADVIELGVPFSDPVADGPVIQRASERALKHGTNLAGVLNVARQIRQQSDAGLIIFSYLNPILQFRLLPQPDDDGRAPTPTTAKAALVGDRGAGGPDLLPQRANNGRAGGPGLGKFCAAASDAGVDGALVTDLPVEEAGDYLRAMKAHKLAPVFLAAPTSTDERLRQIARHSRGFVYAISRTGITGARQELAADARNLVERLRSYTKLPIAVGFGVSTPQQFAEVGSFADAAVVGSAIVQCIEKNQGREAAAVAEFVSFLMARAVSV